MNYEIIINLAIMLFLSVGAILDLRTRNISNKISFSFIFVMFILAALNQQLVEGLIVATLITLQNLYLFYKEKIGGADVKYLFALALGLGLNFFYIIGVMLVLLFIWAIFNLHKKESFPLVTVMCISHFLVLLAWVLL